MGHSDNNKVTFTLSLNILPTKKVSIAYGVLCMNKVHIPCKVTTFCKTSLSQDVKECYDVSFMYITSYVAPIHIINIIIVIIIIILNNIKFSD
jgi:hypothetical protein